jgi:signal peptidase II
MLAAVVLSLVIDLGSKYWAFERVAAVPVSISRAEVIRVKETIDPRAITQELIPPHEPMVVVPGALNFQLVLNPGAVFGVGPGKRLFFIGFTALALGFSLMMFARWTKAGDLAAHAGIGLVIGGGVGNLYDRLVYACVRDFIHPLPGLNWPGGFTLMGSREVWPYVSNLADLFLLIGIVILLVHLWRRDAELERASRDLRRVAPK